MSALSSESAHILNINHIDLHLKSEAGNVHILKDISLSLPSSKTVSIMGPSGSGKTTLLMVLAGLEKPTSGTVEVAGTELGGLSEDDLATFRRDNIGIVFQNFHLIPTMTALENVAIPLEFAGHKDAFKNA
ncbi:MAG: ATP-binding cassette domain-containing protein, partial [Alphaproteobacteria bacterium]|nr:ATP-binding cassette domain-containing protein [Alphaproteobacteria bacterium]